ncbi:MAG: S8 family serine peptidase, partial [Candidatus Heimdallarchaeota archaeon]|nr:S8 family serine peptidase [Candidatus Heimdallarchaeota archaeon]
MTAYSSQGPGETSNTTKPDLVAPGGVSSQGAILQVDSNDADADGGLSDQLTDDFTSIQGTSMATPFVSGAAALLIEALGGFTSWTFGSALMPFKIKQLLLMTAHEIYSDDRGGKDNVEGYGRINPYAAISAVVSEYTIGTTASENMGQEQASKKVWARSISLLARVTYTFDLLVPAGSDFDLFLYDDDPNQYGEPVLIQKSASPLSGSSNHEFITYTPGADGSFYIVVKVAFSNTNSGRFILSSIEGIGFPRVFFNYPIENQKLSGDFVIQINASDTDLKDISFKVESDHWINITDSFNIASGYYEYDFNFTSLGNQAYTLVARATDQANHISYSVVHISTSTLNSPILLVDDDLGNDYEIFYEEALTGLGFAKGGGYDYWSVSSSGSPSTTTLGAYQLVIWFTSNDFMSTLTTVDQTNLQIYLDSSGNLWIVGQDIGFDIRASSFYTNYLRAIYEKRDTNELIVSGTAGNIYDGTSYQLGGGSGADNNGNPSDIAPETGAILEMVYDGTSTLGAALSYAGIYKLIYMAFSWESIASATDRLDSANRTINWFTLDAPPSSLSITSPLNGSVNKGSLIFSYLGTDDIGLIEYRIFRDGHYITSSSTASISLQNQPNGWHTYRLAGFDSQSQNIVTSVTVYIDDISPTIMLVTPANGTIVNSGITIDLDITDDFALDVVLYNWDGGVDATLTDPFDLTIPSAAGIHILSIVANDTIGNSVFSLFSFSTDDSSPTLDSPVDFTYELGSVGLNITWTAIGLNSNNYILTRDGSLIDSGDWVSGSSITIETDGLVVGLYLFTMTVFTLSGNSNSDTVLVTVVDT